MKDTTSIGVVASQCVCEYNPTRPTSTILATIQRCSALRVVDSYLDINYVDLNSMPNIAARIQLTRDTQG